MSIDENRQNLAIADGRNEIVDAVRVGRLPTFSDVKRSVKVYWSASTFQSLTLFQQIVRNLSQAINVMDELPRLLLSALDAPAADINLGSSFVTFKLYYTDSTPVDYEPPNFSAGDPEDKLVFTTHGGGEVPEKTSIGTLKTPHHG